MNRCMCISTIIRNLTFVPGNDVELCKSQLFIELIANLILFKHKHNKKPQKTTNQTNDLLSDDQINQQPCTAINDDLNDWWWECVNILRENTLVTITNIAAILNLNNYNEIIIKKFLNGLLHWSVCKSTDALDTLTTVSDTSCITAQRLCIESLSKLTINDINIDLLLACATSHELELLFNTLSEWVVKRDEETLREFSIVLLASIAKCDNLAAKLIAKYCSFLISYLEDYEEQTRNLYLQQQHHNPHHQIHLHSIFNDENLGTTVDMLRRCANCLVSIASQTDNLSIIMKYEGRLLDLITSHYVEPVVGQKLAEILYHCNTNNNNGDKTKRRHLIS
jgi:AT-rich interactive domain-containing protein 1